MANDYPPNWPEIAERIKRLARWRCEHCGHKHDPARGYTLTVHHLDGDKANCSYRNLVAMCQRCHLRWQATWHPGQPFLFDPPLWAIRRGLATVEGHRNLNELTPFDQELMRAIQDCAGPDGVARSLFYVAVRVAGIDYAHAHHRLRVLEVLGYVHVDRPGPGLPLAMRTAA